MKRNRIRNIILECAPGQSVTVCGWIRSKRESKGVAFIALSDGSTQDTLQLVIPAESSAFGKLPDCNTGAAVKVMGVLKESPGKGQKYEVEVSEIELFGNADSEKYPLQKKGHSLEFLREIGHLRPRTNTFGALFRVRNVLADAVHDFFQNRGFLWVHTPIITSSDCEGAGDLFTVTSLELEKLPAGNNGDVDFSQDFFGRRAYLTVSGQLEAEFMAMALGDVYTFGPTFRAENSNTSRHLSEFWMIEPEMAFADLADDMELAEDFIHTLCTTVLEKCEGEIAFFEKFYKNTSINELRTLAEKPFTRISYTEAVKKLEQAKKKFEFPVEWGLDLQSEHEKFLTDKVFNGPGSQREERLDVLEERMKELKIPLDSMEWYLDLRRYGSAPHAGFGLGFERLVQYITGMSNIRDVIPCPRAPQSIKF
jgi:asparaginyl-tRNA synthetase